MNQHHPAAPELEAIDVRGTTRSAFLVRGTLAAGAVLGSTVLPPFVSRALAQGDGGDVDVLNYALTLEVVEATFYERGLKQTPGLDKATKRLARRSATTRWSTSPR